MSLPMSGTGGSKGGLGNAELMSLLNNIPNANFNPAQVAPAGPAPDFDAQLSNFYGDDPMKITQPYQDYYKSLPLPGDESRPVPAPVPPPVVAPPVIRDPAVVRNQGQNMNFNNPMVGTVEMPDIAPGGGMMEDFGIGGGMGSGRLFKNIPIPQPASFAAPSVGVTPFKMPMGLGGIAPSAPPVSFFDPRRNMTGVGGNIIEDFVPSMPILDAAPKPKGRVATRKKKKRTSRRSIN
jgi:hypothetical protein